MSMTDAPDIQFAPTIIQSGADTTRSGGVPLFNAAGGTGVKLRIPVVDNMNIIEYGIRMTLASPAPSGAGVFRLRGETIAGGAGVDIETNPVGAPVLTLTLTAAATGGKTIKRITDVEVLKSVTAFVTLELTVADANACFGIPYIKYRSGGSVGGADTGDIVVTV